VTFRHTPTADNQIIADIVAGVFYLVDCDFYLIGAADYIATCVKATSNTAFTVFNSTAWDRRTGNITKALIGWEFAGAGTFGVFNASTSARASYTAGTSCLYSITGTGSFTKSGGAGIWASSSAFSGEIRGFCCTATSSAKPRIVTGTQIRIAGTSGGTATASHLDSGGNSGLFDIAGCEFFISGFTTENITNTDAGDSQRIYLSTTNKTLAKVGTGLASVTPLDLAQSGFVQWAGNGTYFTFVPATRVFTLSRTCIGMLKSSQVYVASGQTVTCTNFAINFIYADSSGVLSVTTDPAFDDKILLFSLYSDGTNYSTSKQTHPVSFPAAVSGFSGGTGGVFADRYGFWYNFIFATLIIAFTYFYTAIMINPNQLADDMKRNGGFVPGVKPGKSTAEFIDQVMSRITLPGSIFLAFVAILPSIAIKLGINSAFADFFGGTSLLILVGVVLDTLQQIETYLLNRHYDGLMKNGRIKGRSNNQMTMQQA
jgi:hypothetical protein